MPPVLLMLRAIMFHSAAWVDADGSPTVVLLSEPPEMSITVAARVTCFSVIPGAVPRGHPDPVVPATLLTDAPAEVNVTVESAEPVGMEITAAIIAMQNAVLDRDRSFTPWRVD